MTLEKMPTMLRSIEMTLPKSVRTEVFTPFLQPVKMKPTINLMVTSVTVTAFMGTFETIKLKLNIVLPIIRSSIKQKTLKSRKIELTLLSTPREFPPSTVFPTRVIDSRMRVNVK